MNISGDNSAFYIVLSRLHVFFSTIYQNDLYLTHIFLQVTLCLNPNFRSMEGFFIRRWRDMYAV